MKRFVCTAMSLFLICAAIGAQADLLTEWGIPKEVAQRVQVEQPDSWDGNIEKVRELKKEEDPGATDTGWIANIDEVYYDGVSVYVLYTVRQIGATESFGTPDETGRYWLDSEDEHYAENRSVGWHEDCLMINGKKADMPTTDEAVYGSAEPGVLKHYMKIRLDQVRLTDAEEGTETAAAGEAEGMILGLPIGDEMHLNGRALTYMENRQFADAKAYPAQMGYVFAELNVPEVETKTFEVNRKIGKSEVGTVETILTPVRLYVNVN